MSMARLWRDQGKREEARDLLAGVYGLSITHNFGSDSGSQRDVGQAR
jgi:hypothetical protein